VHEILILSHNQTLNIQLIAKFRVIHTVYYLFSKKFSNSKHMKLFKTLLFCNLFFSISLFAQKDVEITSEKLSDNIYVLYGQGGNIGLCVGEDGAFIIDDQYPQMTEKIKAAVAEITDQPIKFIFNTHWHGDHTGGNGNLAKEGAIIVAHKNVRKRLSTDQFMKTFSRTVEAKPKEFWPVITFDENINLYFNEEDILATHVHNAHTDGDAIVYFPKSNIIHMGDTFFKDRYPFFDISSGGSINGMIEASNKVLFLANKETKIIPGHGKMANKEDLKRYRDNLMEVRDRVQKAITEGKSFDEIQAAKLTSDLDAEWGTSFINGEKIVNFIYTDLTRGN